MTTSRHYTLITPRADRTGPTNVAVDIGRAALAAGWETSLLYLSGEPSRADTNGFSAVRRFRLRDLWQLKGVVHTHCLRPDLVGWFLTWNRRCEVVTTLHNYFKIDLAFDHRRSAVQIAWWLWSRAISRFAHRVCISATMQRYYRRELPALGFDLAYNFRGPSKRATRDDAPAFPAWLEMQRAKGHLVLAYVGSLSPRKNLSRMLDALGSMPEMALVLCGEGPQGFALRARAAQDDLAGRVLFVGQIGAPADVLGASDLLVLPSLAEGLPLVILEAAQAGRPTLMSNIAVHRELAHLGFGQTFDRHRFTDFRTKAHALAGAPGGSPDPRLVELWQKRFSVETGFRQYADLVSASADEADRGT